MDDIVEQAVNQTVEANKIELVSKNGHANDGPQASDMAPVKHLPGGGVSWGKKLRWMDMPEDYAGMKVRVWVNYPNKWDSDIVSRDNDTMRSALKQIFLEHNGWVTPEECEAAQAEGRSPIPMPQPNTDEFWLEAPNELVGAMILLINRETVKLPNSMIAKFRS